MLISLEILRDTLLPSARNLFGRQPWLLCQDNDPKHTSNLAKDFYSSRRIHLIEDWPSASPDINPIENIWSIMKDDVGRRMPETKQELRDSIIQAWDDIDLEVIERCILDLPGRLEEVIEKNGEKTDH